jgi:diguanylate cyclase (GGDEF)-like protein
MSELASSRADSDPNVGPGYWARALGLRVVIAVAYFVLIPAGLLPMSTAWWLISGGSLLAWSAGAYAYYRRQPDRLWLHATAAPYIDVVIVTVAIVALDRIEYPLWIGYFLIINGLSATHSTRYVLAFTLWTIGAFWAGYATLYFAGGEHVSWQLGTVVSIMAVFTAANADTISTSNRKLRELVISAALTDPLTGLDNRRRFMQVLESHDVAGEKPLAVLMYDLDNFKQLNEVMGHLHADSVLVRVAAELRSCFRDADTVARYGGDEIIVLAHVTDVADAEAMARRSLQLIRDEVGVTMSVGVSLHANGDAPEHAVRAADAALGRAKRSGKAQHALAAG